MSIEVEMEDLNEIVSEVYASLAGVDLRPAQDADGVDTFRSGRIHVHGDVKATIVLEGNREIVAAIAGAMFDRPVDELDDEQMTDAWAELTNMVGGNIKCLLDEENHLGLPEVSTHSEEGPSPAAADCTYRHRSQSLRCRVFAA